MTVRFVSFSLHGAAALPAASTDQEGFRRVVRPTLTVLGASKRTVKSAPLALLGPADVVGVDPDQIVRRTPQPGDQQAEPNYLAAIDFAHPDLPWLFTADTNRTAPLPWLMLVVVDDVGPDTVTPAVGAGNPTLTVDPAQLQDPADAAAWAHIQISNGAPAELLNTPSAQWSLVRSRVLSPRRLGPDRSYVACLVPVFEAGRIAGLGIRPIPAAVGPATWDHTVRLPLPVYDHWRFSTGQVGDFESLAARLRPADSAGQGSRRVAVDPVAARLQHDDAPELFPSAVRQVPTAMAADNQPGSLTPGIDSDPQAPGLGARLKVLLDITAAAADDPHPIVGPPLYGQWHAAVTSLDGQPGADHPALVVPSTPSAQAWIADLNADPDVRLAAGLGTRIVQRDQESLMADAWAQLDPVAQANDRVRWAQFASTVAIPLHDQLGTLPDADALRVLNPVLDNAPPPDVQPVDGFTIVNSLQDVIGLTNVSQELLAPAFLHAARFASRAMGGGVDQPSEAMLVETTFDAVQAASPEFVPDRFVTVPSVDLDSLGRAVTNAGAPDVAVGTSTAGEVLTALRDVDTVVADTLAQVTATAPPTTVGENPNEILARRFEMIAELQRAAFANVQLSEPDPTALFVAMTPSNPQPDTVGRGVVVDADALMELTLPPDPALPALVRLDETFASAAIESVSPVPRYSEMLADEQSLVEGASGIPQQRSALHPISATPVFDTPMIERLRLLDQEWVLGGVGELDIDRVYLMAANRRFVEALLVGANHEMLRELRWRGYPADPRGSSFRRFWPTIGVGDQPVPDVAPLRDWTGRLGENKPDGSSDNSVTIVVIKAELLRRYPSTIITMEFGAVDAGRFVKVRTAQELFRGRLEPDVSYLAFAIDPDDDLHRDDGTNRWFLSLLQPIDEPRFGLDEFVPDPDNPDAPAPPNTDEVPDNWTWQGLTPPDPPFLSGSQVDAGDKRGTSAQVGANLFQRPFRALLAARDRVPGPS